MNKKNTILQKNINYLLSHLGFCETNTFTQAIGVNASTVSRWKNGSHLPDPYSQEQICSYFGINNCSILNTIDLQADAKYIPPQILKQYCIDVIRHMDIVELKTLYASLAGRQKKQDASPIQQYLNTFHTKSIDYYELVARIMFRFDMNKEAAENEIKCWRKKAAANACQEPTAEK